MKITDEMVNRSAHAMHERLGFQNLGACRKILEAALADVPEPLAPDDVPSVLRVLEPERVTTVARGHSVALSNGNTVAIGRLDPPVAMDEGTDVTVYVYMHNADAGSVTAFGLSDEAADALFHPNPPTAVPWEQKINAVVSGRVAYRHRLLWEMTKIGDAEPPEIGA